MKSRKIFQIIDADTNVSASITSDDADDAPDYITISRGGGYDDLITLTLADFRRMVAAVEHQY